MPVSLGRRNLAKIRWMLENMEAVLAGLTRGLDLAVLDATLPGAELSRGPRLGFQRQSDGLGAVLPGNSPGVHSLWLPAIALKTPLVLKPGREEPWTPYRITQALRAAGCPPAALGFYPTDHAGSSQILLRCGRSLLFGDGATVRPWAQDHRVEIHGPGWSKVILGADEAAAWERHLDLLVTSIAENGGRSCINTSGVWLAAEAGQGRALAEALAARLAAIEPRPLDDPEAALAAFPNRDRARKISEWIDRQLHTNGAVDLTAEARGGSPRVAEVDGCTFLRPTLVWCEDPEHPLATAELLFPFATVVEAPQAELARRIGPTLVATVLTGDDAFAREILACPTIDRLNLGAIPTCRIAWDQPHEGNLFEHLYRRRAFEVAAA
jgi:acyl-CoA reductase-like NAD-dependent aldehyde dehydrogenase